MSPPSGGAKLAFVAIWASPYRTRGNDLDPREIKDSPRDLGDLRRDLLCLRPIPSSQGLGSVNCHTGDWKERTGSTKTPAVLIAGTDPTTRQHGYESPFRRLDVPYLTPFVPILQVLVPLFGMATPMEQ